MPEYEWTGDGEFRDNLNDRQVGSGETLRLPERVGDPNDELVRVDGDDDDEEAEEAEAPFDPGEHTVDEIEEGLAQRPDEVTDADLQALLDAERAGEDRETAKDAIEAAMEE